jgi:uncharacterized protein
MDLNAAQILALLALLLIALSLNVSRLRLRHKVSYGDGGHKDLLMAVRAHGNALEQSLLFALLLLALETRHGAGVGIISILGLAFLLARVLHVLAIFQRWLLLRQAAHVATLAAQLVAVLALLQ